MISVLRCVLFLSLLGFTPVALAVKEGVDTSGGGVSFVCKTKEGERVYLADSYSFFTGDRKNDVDTYNALFDYWMNGKNGEEILHEDFKNRVATQNVDFAYSLWISSMHMKFVPVDKELKPINDDKILKKNIPKNCIKKQLAAQNYRTGIVEYNKDLYERLSPLEKVLFKYHEVYVSRQSNKEKAARNTHNVRCKVDNIADNSTKAISDLVDSIKKIISQEGYHTPIVTDKSPFTYNPSEQELEEMLKAWPYAEFFFTQTSTGKELLSELGFPFNEISKDVKKFQSRNDDEAKKMRYQLCAWYLARNNVNAFPTSAWTNQDWERIHKGAKP